MTQNRHPFFTLKDHCIRASQARAAVRKRHSSGSPIHIRPESVKQQFTTLQPKQRNEHAVMQECVRALQQRPESSISRCVRPWPPHGGRWPKNNSSGPQSPPGVRKKQLLKTKIENWSTWPLPSWGGAVSLAVDIALADAAFDPVRRQGGV